MDDALAGFLELIRENGKIAVLEGDLLDISTDLLVWIASRHSELCSFSSLQKSCNALRDTSTEDKKQLIRDMLKHLLADLEVTPHILNLFQLVCIFILYQTSYSSQRRYRII